MRRKQADHRRGRMLSDAIRDKMDERGMSAADFATAIGLSQSYTNSLLNSGRDWDGTPLEVREKIASFLGIPMISALMLAEIVEPRHFVYDDSIDASLQNLFGAIRAHPVWGGFCRSKERWDAMALDHKILIALLYERAMEVEILKKARLIQAQLKPATKRTPRKKPAA